MMQNELVFSDAPVHDARIEAFKAGNSICTIILLYLLYRYDRFHAALNQNDRFHAALNQTPALSSSVDTVGFQFCP